jgi:hypothetical protein
MAGISHYLIFVGVVVPILTIAALSVGLTLPYSIADYASLFLDVTGLALLTGLTLAFGRRALHPEEFSATGRST